MKRSLHSTSTKAYRALSSQAANTANRAAKLAVRKAAHANTMKTAVKVQAGVQAFKAVSKCVLGSEEQECEQPC